MSEWRFPFDENIDPGKDVSAQGGVHAEHVRDALRQGTDDEDDVLPYVREHDPVIVTSDVKDFGDVRSTAHAGIVNDETGDSIVEKWMVEGMGHAWSGGAPGGEFAAPGGPDASEIIRDFCSRFTRAE